MLLFNLKVFQTMTSEVISLQYFEIWLLKTFFRILLKHLLFVTLCHYFRSSYYSLKMFLNYEIENGSFGTFHQHLHYNEIMENALAADFSLVLLFPQSFRLCITQIARWKFLAFTDGKFLFFYIIKMSNSAILEKKAI